MKTSIGFPWEIRGLGTASPELRCKVPTSTGGESTVIVRFETEHFDKGPGWYVLHTGSYIHGPAKAAQEAVDFAEARVRSVAAHNLRLTNERLATLHAFSRIIEQGRV